MYDITISTVVKYLPEHSDAEHFLFAYTITIENIGTVGAKLLKRKWLITDANNKTEEVYGAGVVGEQPHLKPNEKFQYTSSAMLPTPVGHMQGHYEMIADDQTTFNAPIPMFSLAVPHILN